MHGNGELRRIAGPHSICREVVYSAVLISGQVDYEGDEA